MTPFDAYETVIGLECHVQLMTEAKLFSPARNRYGDPPNENVDVVDLGLPGVLPVLNRKAVDFAVRLGLALGCEVNLHSVFARKHYFYPDLPKGYQISQFEQPICTGGSLLIELPDGSERRIHLTRIHIEEDAGKSLHIEGRNASFCDYNRAGTPLLEVVSEPELRTPEEATAYMRALRSIAMYLGVCDGNLQEGSMRADANVSVRKKGAAQLGQRTEMKNLNSPRFLAQAIENESRRQILELEAGREIIQETRLWDSDRKESRSMRGKEEAHDYRYFPDPDLPPLVLTQDEVDKARGELPELPYQKRKRFVENLGISKQDALVLTEEKAIADYFEMALQSGAQAKGVANWIINELLRAVKGQDDGSDEESGAIQFPISAQSLGVLVLLIDQGAITGKIAKKVFAAMLEGEGEDPKAIVQAHGWQVERDEGAITAAVDEVLAANPKQVEQYRGGKTQLLGFFVGQIMKATRGKADPAEVNRLLKEKLGGE